MNGFNSINARRSRSAVCAVFASVLASLAVPAQAYQIEIGGSVYFGVSTPLVLDQYGLISPTPQSRQAVYNSVAPTQAWHGRAASGVDAFGLHASASVNGSNVAAGPETRDFIAGSQARVTFADVVIAGPAGAGPIQTSINLHLSGTQALASYVSATPDFLSRVNSNVFIGVTDGGNNRDGGNRSLSHINGVPIPPNQNGMLMGYTGSGNVQTRMFTLLVNTPFSLSLSIGTTARIGVAFSDSYVTGALSDFGNTLSFATDRPVFRLPAGYTVNSADAGIVNNTFSTPVPEPASAVLAALGLVLVGARVRRRRIAAAAASALLPLLAATPSHSAVQFTVTNLGTLGGTSSEAFAINASGQVAGRAGLANGATHATRWTNGVAQDLGTFGGRNSVAYGINDAGQVAGVANLAGDFFVAGALWAADGTPQQLIAPNTLDTAAFALNNGGAVVGDAPRALPATGIAPVEWRNGMAMSAPLSIGATVSGSARAINNAGQVAGRVGDSAALWLSEAAEVQLLPRLSGTLPTTAAAINAAGAVAGSALTAVGTTRAVLWQFGGVSDLGSLGGASSDAYGLNDRGEVVGRAMTAAGVFQGFFRAGGDMVNLNSMLAPGSGVTVTTARAINVHGQIAGTATVAGQTRAVLLTPTGSVAWQAAGNGSFADATRWEQGFQPSKFVDASINGIGSQTITVGADATAKSLSLGSAAGSPGRPTLALQNGAVLSVAQLFPVQATGTLAGDGTVAGSVVNLGTVRPGNLSITGSFSNQGLVTSSGNGTGTGSGVFNAALVNTAAGQVRSGAGESLQVLGNAHSNAGTIEITGGGQQRYVGLLSNQAGGRIQLDDATLRLDGGLVNAGQVEAGFGGATVRGNIGTTAGGKIILSGRSDTTFYNAVTVDAGGELRVSSGATALFFGAVTQRTGALFTGTGTKFYEGGLSIGTSPGLGLDAGSVNFGVGNLYTAEIGGTTACTAACATDAALRDRSFDKYIVSGHLGLGGALKLVSWAGFTGQIGQSFDLLDWGSSSGSFASIDASGLSLASGAVLDTSQLYTAGVLRVTAVPEPGTWALLLFGIGMLLLRLRARRPAR